MAMVEKLSQKMVKRQLYIKGETIHKKYKNTEYTKYKTNIQNKRITLKRILKTISRVIRN
jgi:hypothetical protein